MKCYTLGNCHPLLMSKATRSRQSYLYNIFFFTTPSVQIMLSIYLNSSTCKYLSLDNGVTMTSKRRENINLVSFICLSLKYWNNIWFVWRYYKNSPPFQNPGSALGDIFSFFINMRWIFRNTINHTVNVNVIELLCVCCAIK